MIVCAQEAFQNELLGLGFFKTAIFDEGWQLFNKSVKGKITKSAWSVLCIGIYGSSIFCFPGFLQRIIFECVVAVLILTLAGSIYLNGINRFTKNDRAVCQMRLRLSLIYRLVLKFSVVLLLV
jgi:hypothetical protein